MKQYLLLIFSKPIFFFSTNRETILHTPEKRLYTWYIAVLSIEKIVTVLRVFPNKQNISSVSLFSRDMDLPS